MNYCCFLGNLTRDPELRNTQAGVSVTNFTLAVRGYQDRTDFIKCTAWRGVAESLCKYMKSGDRICVVGRLESTQYEKDGKTVYGMEVVCESIEFCTVRKAPKLDAELPM